MSDAPRAPLGAPSHRTTLAGPPGARPPLAAPPLTGAAGDTPSNWYTPSPHHVDCRP